MAILKRRSRMITFRLSEDEYTSLRSLCENEGARSISDLARDAVHRLLGNSSKAELETALRVLEARVDTLDVEVQRLTRSVDQAPQAMRQANGKI